MRCVRGTEGQHCLPTPPGPPSQSLPNLLCLQCRVSQAYTVCHLLQLAAEGSTVVASRLMPRQLTITHTKRSRLRLMTSCVHTRAAQLYINITYWQIVLIVHNIHLQVHTYVLVYIYESMNRQVLDNKALH